MTGCIAVTGRTTQFVLLAPMQASVKLFKI